MSTRSLDKWCPVCEIDIPRASWAQHFHDHSKDAREQIEEDADDILSGRIALSPLSLREGK